MANVNEPAEPQPGSLLPERDAPLSPAGLPLRRPVTDSGQPGGLLQRGEPVTGPLPRRFGPADDAQPLPRRGLTDDSQLLPQRLSSPDLAQPLPQRGAAPADARPPTWRVGRADDALPRRGGAGDEAQPLPQRGAPEGGRPLPRRGGAPDGGQPMPLRGGLSDDSQPLPRRGGPTDDAQPLPRRGGAGDGAQPLPRRGGAPEGGQPLPQRGGAPEGGQPLPQRGGVPGDSQPLPRRGGDGAQPLPQRGGAPDLAQPLPQRGGPTDGAQPLPRRTTRTRPPGRHRSPHRLSVASDAPALVLAVPGSAAADTAGIGPAVAAIAELSCPGVDIRVGYLEGHDLALAEYLAPDPEPVEPNQFPTVVVPLLLSPSMRLDPVIRRLTSDSTQSTVLAAHLGPHPLVAEALHSRLADAGLARYSRSSGISISADGRGIVVLADVGEEATSAAAVAAVLLASRLSVPVVPASLGDPASIVTAVDRLTESGAQRPVLAPCLIGPETSISVLDDLSAALGAPCAPALGAHQAIGQLVAIRYGAALASLSLAG